MIYNYYIYADVTEIFSMILKDGFSIEMKNFDKFIYKYLNSIYEKYLRSVFSTNFYS